MVDITDAPPVAVQGELDALSRMLDGDVPAIIPGNLLIATRNIRAFGGLQALDKGGRVSADEVGDSLISSRRATSIRLLPGM